VVGEPLEKREFTTVSAMPHGTETILVVDDDSSIRKLILDTLEPLGYTILVAACGDEALKFCRSSKENIDLLLSDIIMPGMNGRELSEIARNECPEIKTVLMSGYTDNVIAERDGLDQSITFINKPLLPVSLAGKIRSVLDSD
jgi:CheY-like chemotaxis protein